MSIHEYIFNSATFPWLPPRLRQIMDVQLDSGAL